MLLMTTQGYAEMHRGYHWIETRFPSPVFDPISLGVTAATLASVSTGATVAGGVASAAGGILGGLGSYNAYSYKAAVAKQNAEIAKGNAEYATWEGGKAAERQGLADQFQLGKIVTQQAASGTDVNSGTNLAVQQSQQRVASENQMMIRSNASRKAYGYEVERTNLLNEASMDKQAGTNALISGGLNAAGSIIGGASSVSDKWLKFGQQGVSGYLGS